MLRRMRARLKTTTVVHRAVKQRFEGKTRRFLLEELG